MGLLMITSFLFLSFITKLYNSSILKGSWLLIWLPKHYYSHVHTSMFILLLFSLIFILPHQIAFRCPRLVPLWLPLETWLLSSPIVYLVLCFSLPHLWHFSLNISVLFLYLHSLPIHTHSASLLTTLALSPLPTVFLSISLGITLSWYCNCLFPFLSWSCLSMSSVHKVFINSRQRVYNA